MQISPNFYSVITGTASTLIAALLTWSFGFWQPIWTWIVAFLSSIWTWIVRIAVAAWQIISYTVPLPVVILFVLAIFCVWISTRRTSSPIPPNSLVAPPAKIFIPQNKTPTALPQLSENEDFVLRLLAKADGRWVELESIFNQVQRPRLLTEQAIDRLWRKGFLVDNTDYLNRTTYRLSSVGRDHAIDLDYAR